LFWRLVGVPAVAGTVGWFLPPRRLFPVLVFNFGKIGRVDLIHFGFSFIAEFRNCIQSTRSKRTSGQRSRLTAAVIFAVLF
jgi:hypothetical protein